MYQIRLEDEHGVVLKIIFDLTRREAVSLYWSSAAPVVQIRYKRKQIIAERRA